MYGSAALGLGTTILLQLVLLVAVGTEKAGNIIFGYSIAIFIIGFGAAWFPFVNKRMK
jgi:hypothetical protein